MLNLQGKELKIALIEGQLDRYNKKKKSVQKFLDEVGEIIGFKRNTKTGRVEKSNYNYWCKHKSVVNAEPYKGEPVTQELIYRYAIDNNYWTEKELPYTYFKNMGKKVIKRNTEEKIVRELCKKFNYPYKREVFSLKTILETLKFLYDEKSVNKELEKIRREFN